MTEQALLVNIADGIARLTLNRPDSKNALNVAMCTALRDAVYAIRQDRSVRAVILRGAGTAFCSGGDVRGMTVESAEEWRNRIDDLHGWIAQLVDLDRPVIAAVDGVAYGAGFGLALAADFVIATSRARFCMPFMKVGLVPDCAAFYTLPRVVGLARAKEQSSRRARSAHKRPKTWARCSKWSSPTLCMNGLRRSHERSPMHRRLLSVYANVRLTCRWVAT